MAALVFYVSANVSVDVGFAYVMFEYSAAVGRKSIGMCTSVLLIVVVSASRKGGLRVGNEEVARFLGPLTR